MSRNLSRLARLILSAGLLLPTASLAGVHTWDVNEVFSNADGTIQFVELFEANGTAGETGVGNGTVSTTTPPKSHSFGNGPVVGPTTNKTYLLATAAFAALPGAPVPDEIIPNGLLPFFFNPAGDTVKFIVYDSWTFPAIPTDGVQSLHRLTGVGPNSPKNYAGVTNQVYAGPLNPAPTAPLPLMALAVLIVLGTGAVVLKRRATQR